MNKSGRGTSDFRVEKNTWIVAIRWYDNKGVNLLSTLAGVEPADTAKQYDRSTKKHIEAARPNVVKAYDQFMGGVDKLDMMCALYKPTIRMHTFKTMLGSGN